jgi:hypothetical protein
METWRGAARLTATGPVLVPPHAQAGSRTGRDARARRIAHIRIASIHASYINGEWRFPAPLVPRAALPLSRVLTP